MEWALGPWHQLFYSTALLPLAQTGAIVLPGSVQAAWITKPNLQVLLRDRITAGCKGYSGQVTWANLPPEVLSAETWSTMNLSGWVLKCSKDSGASSGVQPELPSCNMLLLSLLYSLAQRACLHHLCKCLRSNCRLQLGPSYTLCWTKHAQVPLSLCVGHMLLASISVASPVSSLSSWFGVSRAGHSSPGAASLLSGREA